MKRSGIGSFMIKQSIGITLLQSDNAGCRFMTVDAYNTEEAVNLYLKNGFQRLIIKEEKDNVPMYMDLIKTAVRLV